MLLQREGPDLCCGTRPPSRDVRVHGESWRVTGPSVGPFSRRPLRQKRIMKADDNGFLWSYLVETWPRAPPTSSTSSASSYARWRGLSAAGGDVDWRALLPSLLVDLAISLTRGCSQRAACNLASCRPRPKRGCAIRRFRYPFPSRRRRRDRRNSLLAGGPERQINGCVSSAARLSSIAGRVCLASGERPISRPGSTRRCRE
jgi:hypothetical protein